MAGPTRHRIESIRAGRRPDTAQRHLWEITAARDLMLLAAAAASLWLLYEMRGIFVPLLVALILAHIFNPLVTWMERKWRWPRPLTIAMLLALFALALAGFLSWLAPLLVTQIGSLARRLPDYLRALNTTYDLELAQAEESFKQLQLNPREILEQLFKTTGKAVGFVTTIFGAATYMLFSLVLVLVYFFFFSWGFNRALARVQTYLPESRRDRAVAIFRQMDQAVGSFFRGRLVISLIMGIMLSIGWFLTGVPYWFFLGMLTGLLNIVPYLSVISWPVAILLKYLDTVTAGGGQAVELLAVVVWPSAVYIAVQLTENWLLTPWIQSGQTNLNPPTIIVVVFIGANLAGVLGMLLAIPAAACIKIVLNEIVLPRLRRWALES